MKKRKSERNWPADMTPTLHAGSGSRKISPTKVNRLLVRTYLKQLLEDGFFHADPHPGNLLVMDSGHLAFFDFGSISSSSVARGSPLAYSG